MKITALVPEGKTKDRIYLDEKYAGILSRRDIAAAGLFEGGELTKEAWAKIEEEFLLPAGRKKALDLLLARERTRRELEERLLLAGYTQEQTVRILQYVDQFPYLDDVRYALHYFCAAGKRKSFRQMQYELRGKGVLEEDISEAYRQFLLQMQEETSCNGQESFAERGDAEKAAIRAFVQKRLRGRALEENERERLYASLMRKGFCSEDIRAVLREY